MLTTDVTQIGGSEPSQTESNAATLGREDFLKMLIAQLENQDPLNPQDSTQFTAQLAQFSSLEQEIAMRSSLDRITTLLDRGDSASAIDLIGKSVLAESSHFELMDGQDVKLNFDLATASDSTEVVIRNHSGDVVWKQQLGAQPAGMGDFVWDGRNQAGGRLAPGVYSMNVDANLDANTVAATPLVWGTVSGADLSTGQANLLLGEVVVPMRGLREVTDIRTGAAP